MLRKSDLAGERSQFAAENKTALQKDEPFLTKHLRKFKDNCRSVAT